MLGIKQKTGRVFLLVLSFMIGGCRTSDTPMLSDNPAEVICELGSNKVELGQLLDAAIINDDTLVCISGNQVIMYDGSGTQVGLVGRRGRKTEEYIQPACVAGNSENILVWDGMSGRILIFDLSGEYLRSFALDVPVADMLPIGKLLYVYKMNGGEGGFIDVLDMETGDRVTSIGNPSQAQYVLTGWSSAAPLSRLGDSVYYMPKDRLVVYREEDAKSWECISKTFRAEQVQDSEALRANRAKMDKYLDENSFIVSIAAQEDKCYILALEGYYLPGDDWANKKEHRYYSIYEVNLENGHSRCMMHFPMGNMLPHLIMPGKNCFYYIGNEIKDTEESYSLMRISIPTGS